MSYTLTSAADRFALFNAIETFATADGWTVDWNVTSNNGQLGLHKGDTYALVGARASTPEITRTMSLSGGSVTDVPLQCALATSFTANQYLWGGHPGVPGGTSNNSYYNLWVNDFYGAFTNVWLFSSAAKTHIHVVTQTADRFSMFSFGKLDNAGMTTSPVSYFTGTFFEFWERASSANSTNYAPNRPDYYSNWTQATSTSSSANTFNRYAFLGCGSSASAPAKQLVQGVLMFPSGVLNPSYFPFGSGVTTGMSMPADMYNGLVAGYLGSIPYPRLFEPSLHNPLNSTIGRPLWALPVYYPQVQSDQYLQFVGNYPDVRSVWFDDTMSPGQELDISGDTWVAFPVKKNGSRSGVAAAAGVNTWGYGLAFKKTV